MKRLASLMVQLLWLLKGYHTRCIKISFTVGTLEFVFVDRLILVTRTHVIKLLKIFIIPQIIESTMLQLITETFLWQGKNNSQLFQKQLNW